MHTLGPWKAHPTYVEIPGTPMILVSTNNPKPGDSSHDTHLIAAAPDLLASAKELLEALAALFRVCVASGHDVTPAYQAELTRLGVADGIGVRAQDAIAKAEVRSIGLSTPDHVRRDGRLN